MKIQGPQRAQVQSLGRNKSSLTGNEGAVKGTQLATQGVTQVLETGAKLAEEAEESKFQRQKQQSGLYAQKSEAEFWSQWGGKDFFDVSELPDEVITEGMQLKGRVASAEVLPKMYQDFVDTTLPEAAKIIERQTGRDEWTADAKAISIGKVSRVQVEANANIDRQIFVDQKINYQNAIDSKRPDLALQIANEMKGSPTEVEQFKVESRKQAETINYEEILINPTEEDLSIAIAYLSQEQEKYKGVNGQLDAGERLAWKNRLETEQARIGKEQDANSKADYTELKRQIGIVEKNSLKGKQSSVQEITDLLAKTNRANEDSGGKLKKQMLDLTSALVTSNYNDKMILLDRDQRVDFISNLENNSKLPEYERDQILLRLEQSNKSLTEQENNNLMQAASDSGFLKNGVSPLDTSLRDPSQSTNQLIARAKQFKAVEANYGEGLGKGMLTKDEAIKINGALNSMNAKKKVEFVGAIVFGLEDDALTFFDQLRVDGGPSSLVIAGVARVGNNPSGSETIIKGNLYRRENKDEMKAIVPLLKNKILTKLSDVYDQNPSYKASVKEAIIDAYVQLVIDNGKDFDSIEQGNFFFGEEDLFQKAVDTATGGLIKQKDVVITPPVYGMPQKVWDDWIDNVSSDYIDELGGVKNNTSSKVIGGIRDGTFILREGRKAGEYFLEDSRNGMFKQGNNGMTFVFKYDEKAPREVRTRTRRGQGGR